MRPLSLVVGLLCAFILTGCGAGNKIISHIEFDQEVVADDLLVEMDATLAPGGIVLPQVVLPVYHPRNPSRKLGEVETDGLHIILRMNASEALRLPDLADGNRLPNGANLPLVLPSGMNPIGIPVFNSNSRVYLAVNGNQLLAGVAVTIAKEDRLNLPLGIFRPFAINSEIHGTGGFFLGEKQGVAVFALREKASIPAAMSSNFAASKIQVRDDDISYSSVRRLEKTWNDLRRVQID